jgi:hypothetical protein
VTYTCEMHYLWPSSAYSRRCGLALRSNQSLRLDLPSFHKYCGMLSSLWMAESPRLNDTLSRARWVYGHAKSILFVYILLTQSLKAQRHLRARGLSSFIRDLYRWVCQRAIFLFLRLPAARRKVELEINKAKLDIEDKLVPKGADVSRHLSLPAEGKSLQWILVEMDKMDRELAKYSGGHTAEWEDGKISGAIYRAFQYISGLAHY